MEEKSSTERKNLFIKAIVLVVLILLALLSTMLYIFAYPKTTVILYDSDMVTEIGRFSVRKYSALSSLPGKEKPGHEFVKWKYENGEELDITRELEEDTLVLYAEYNILSYTITYHVQTIDPITGNEIYVEDVEECEQRTLEYATQYRLPDGVSDKTGQMIKEFSDRKGYKFVGWTTRIVSEENVQPGDIHYANSLFTVPAGNVDFYAYWEKMRYGVVMHTGVQYETLDGTPVTQGGTLKTDANGEYIIKNDRVRNETQIKYLDYMTMVTDNYQNIVVTEEEVSEGSSEYEFLGWYVDPDFTIKVSDYMMEVAVDDNDIPYLSYKDGNVRKTVASVFDAESKSYKFHLYSKWARKSYTVSFDTNSVRTNAKIQSVKVYKYDSLYGKYYNYRIDGRFDGVSDYTREGEANGKYYNHIDLSSTEITTNAFLNSNKNYRFIGWTTEKDISTEGNRWYYQWKQTEFNKRVVGANNLIEFINKDYIHTESKNITLYAQWSQIYTVIFAFGSGINTETFTKELIRGEWLWLPGTAEVATYGWEKEYNQFAGWTTNLESSFATKYYELDDEGFVSADFAYEHKSNNNIRLYVLWEKTKYSIYFYNNDGSENGGKGSLFTSYPIVYGDTNKYFPTNKPTREGYVFEGWSRLQYEVDKYAADRYDNITLTAENKAYGATTNQQFKITGNEDFYAVWTKDYKISYDANGGTGATPVGHSYSIKSPLRMTITPILPAASSLQLAGNSFGGWQLKAPDGSILQDERGNEYTFTSNSGSMVFDFKNKTVKFVRNGQTITAEILMEGANKSEVKFYAKWQPKTFTVKLKNTLDNNKTVEYKVTYGTPFNFLDVDGKGTNINLNYSKVGYIFLGWGLTDTDTTPTYVDSIPGDKIIENITLYTVYTQKTINLHYYIEQFDGTTIEFTPTVGTTSQVGYGGKIILPTPTSSAYGNNSYVFSYWYYYAIPGDYSSEQIVLENGQQFYYTEDDVDLFAVFVPLTYDLTFNFITPYENEKPSEDGVNPKYFNITITRTVDKNLRITDALYDGIINEFLNKLTIQNGVYYSSISDYMKEYSLDGLYNFYTGNDGGKAEFAVGKVVSGDIYKLLNSYNAISFDAVWTPNTIKLAYRTAKNGYEEVIGSEIYNFNYEGGIALHSGEDLFTTLDSSNKIVKWYLDDTHKYDVSGVLVPAGTKVNTLSNYITWVYDVNTLSYVGYIYLYAEVEKLFTINYLVYDLNAGEFKVVLSETEIKYDPASNNHAIPTDAKTNVEQVNNMAFDSWRIGSINGTELRVNSIYLNPEAYTEGIINLYAMVYFNLNYSYIDSNLTTQDLITEKIYYYNNGVFYGLNTSNIPASSKARITSAINSIEIPTGYTLYGLQSNGVIYNSTTAVVPLSGVDTDIVVYIAKQISITYDVKTYGALFVSANSTINGTDTNIVRDGYLVGYDGTKISEIRIDELTASKGYDVFDGWSVVDGDSTVYGVGQIIQVADSVTLKPVFSTIEAGAVSVRIIYKNTRVDLPNFETTVTNGSDIELKTGKDLGWELDGYSITAWAYDGKNYSIGSTFSIPVQVLNGQEFVFETVYTEVYTINFDKVLSDELVEAVEPVKVVDGTQLTISNSLIPSIKNNNKAIQFNHYTYEYTALDGEIITFNILPNDKVIISSAERNPRTEDSFGYYTHYIPKVDSFIFTFTAVWETADITLNIVVTNDEDNSIINSGSISVKYGDSYTARGLIEAYRNTEIMQLLLNRETNILGVVGWSSSANNIAEDSIINNIVGTKTIYTVWAAKYAVTFNSGDFTYNGGKPTTSYYFAGESVSVDSSITKSISQDGFLTVYFDNGKYVVYNENETIPHRVSGYVVYNGADTLASIDISESFTMPSANVSITPVFGNVTRINFRENGAVNNGETIVKTVYLLPLETLKLSEYTISRTGFEFVGWSTNKNDTTAQNDYTATSNADVVNMYALWLSDIKVSFYVSTTNEIGTDELFAINVDKEFKIDATLLENELNKFRNTTLVLGNTNIYTYNGLNYYLENYRVGADLVDLQKLLTLPFQSDSNVYLRLLEIYTIAYDAEEYDLTLDKNYVITSGQLVAMTEDNTTGIIETLTLPSVTVDTSSSYYVPDKWAVGTWLESFDSVINLNKIQQLIYTYADENYTITLSVVSNPKSYNVKAYTYTGTELFELYKNAEDSDDVLAGLTVVTDKLINSNGIYLTTEGYSVVNGKISLPYGTVFGIAIAEEYYHIDNFTLMGWAISLDKLGGESILVNSGLMYDSTNKVYVCSNIIVDKEYFDANDEIILYPVYTADIKEFYIITDSYGTVSVTFEASDNVGYITYSESNTVNVAVKTTAIAAISILDKVTISVASCINANLYEFDKFTKNTSDTALSNPLVLTYANVTDEDAYYSKFKTKEISIKFTLNYGAEPKSADTQTNIIFASTSGVNVTLNSSNRTTDAITFNATDTIAVTYEVNELYTMNATSNGLPITITRGYLNVDELSIVDGSFDVTITLTPPSYVVTFALYGGELDSSVITATNEIFEISSLNLVDNKLTVPAGTRLSILSNPTKENYSFVTWKINGIEYSQISNLLIDNNMVISAEYVTNRFAINYQIDNNTVVNYFTGGDSVVLSVSDTDIPKGYTISKWKDVQTGTEYAYGATITKTESRSYTLVATLVGKELNIVYLDTLGATLKTDKVTYGSPYIIANNNVSDFSSLDHTKSINWFVGDSYYREEDIISTANLEYAENIYLTLTYFDKYTYTINYNLEKSYDVDTDTEITDSWNQTITSDQYEIHAYNGYGSVNASELNVTVNSITPLNSQNEYYEFGGYYVKLNGEYLLDGDNNKITVSPNTRFTLVEPTQGISSYTYEFIPVRVSSGEAKTLTFNITNPTTQELMTTINVKFIVRLMLTVNELPNMDLTTINGSEVTWTTGDKTEYFEAYQLIGYRFNGKDYLFSDTDGWSIAGYNEYVFTSIWLPRTVVNFYNQSANKITEISGYYNQGRLDLSTIQSYYEGVNRDGYYFLGLTPQNAFVTADSTYYTFDGFVTVGTTEINLYPALTQCYTIVLNTNDDTLVDKLDSSYTVQGDSKSNTIELYVSNSIVDLNVLFNDIYYGDLTSAKRGYTLAGFSLEGGKLKHESVTLITDGKYSLVPSHADGNIITIYLVWERETLDVTLSVDARYNDNSEFTSVNNIVIELFYNQTFDETNTEIANYLDYAVDAAQYWTFDNYYLGVNGQNLVTSSTRINSDNMIIYLYFTPKYTVVYEADNYTVNGTLPEPQVIIPNVTPVNNFSIANISKTGLTVDYWTAEGSNNANFFSTTPRIVDLDTDKLIINKYYQIILIPHCSTAEYTINIHYLDTTDEIHNYLLGNNVEFSTITLNNVQYGSYLGSITDITNFTTLFDGKLSFDGQTGLDFYNGYYTTIQNNTDFECSVYVSETAVLTQDTEVYNLFNLEGDNCYTVGLFENPDGLINDLYLVYSYTYYTVEIAAVEVDEFLQEKGRVDALVSVRIDSAETQEIVYSYYPRLNIDQTIEFMTPIEQDSYIFKGYYVKNLSEEFVPLDSNYSEFATLSGGRYSVFKDCEIYALYDARTLDIRVNVYIDNETGEYAESILNKDLGVQIISDGILLADTYNSDTKSAYSTISAALQYGSDLFIYAYAAENSKYDFTYSVVKKNSTEYVTTSYSSTYGMYLTLVNTGDVENFVFDVYFEIKPVEVMFNTYVTINADTQDVYDDFTVIADMPETIYYTLLSQYESSVYNLDVIYNNKTYNFAATVKYGSTINVDSIIPVLNNCTFVGWVDENGDTVTGSILVESTKTLLAVFTPNTIAVNYLDNSNNIIYIQNVTFGKTITLPYIIVEDDKTVSYSWNQGEWGSEFTLNNISEDYSINGYNIKAIVVDKYYLIYNNGIAVGFDGFDLPSDYPRSVTDANVQKFALIPIILDSDITYRIYYKTMGEEKNSGEGLTLFDYKTHIPNTPIPEVGAIQFVAWKTNTNREVNNRDSEGYYYSVRENEAEEIDGKNVVTLYPISSTTRILHFYITDPTDANNETVPTDSALLESYPSTLKLSSSSMNIDFSQECISMEVDVDAESLSQNVIMGNNNSSLVEFYYVNNGRQSFFVDNQDKDLTYHYTFYGWTTKGNQTVFSDIRDLLGSSSETMKNYALLYDIDATGKRIDNNTAAINNPYRQAINDLVINQKKYDLYAVWEINPTVIFDARTFESNDITNGFIEEYKFGRGVEVNLNLYPNQTKVNTLSYAGHKLTGWTDGNLTYNLKSSKNVYYVGDRLTLTSVWAVGARVYFNINFEEQRLYYANAVSTDANPITTDIIGYPHITADNITNYNVINKIKVNDVEYPTMYQEGNYWVEGESLSFSKYQDEYFSHEGIYIASATKDKYFNLVGWEYKGTIYDPETAIITFNSVLASAGSITFNAVWEVININVQFYYSANDIKNNGDKYRTSDGYITIEVPFGHRLTNIESQASDTITYLYDDYASILDTPLNYKETNSELIPFWRFMYWSSDYNYFTATPARFFVGVQTTDYKANSVSTRVLDDLKLFPYFVKQYQVRFMTTIPGQTATKLFDATDYENENYNYVAIGEGIIINENLTDNLGNMISVVSQVYTGMADGRYAINSNAITTSTTSIVFTGSGTDFTINLNRYVDIYLEIEVNVVTYIPNPTIGSGDSAVVYTNIKVPLGQFYWINNQSNLTTYDLTSRYGSNAPTFKGWYYSDTSNPASFYTDKKSDAYKLSGIGINPVYTYICKLNLESSPVSFTITITYMDGTMEEKTISVDNNQLCINFFAKLTVTTTIALSDVGDYKVLDYAYLTVEDSSYKDYYELLDGQVGQLSKIVTFKNVFRSETAPNILVRSVEGEFYTIEKAELYQGNYDNSPTNLNKSLNIGNSSTYYTNVSELTYNSTTTGLNSTIKYSKSLVTQAGIFNGFKHTFSVYNIDKGANNTIIKITMAPIRYEISYTWNTDTEILMLRTKAADIGFTVGITDDSHTADIEGSEITFSDSGVSLYNGAGNIVFEYTVQYFSQQNGSLGTITFTNVPYGAKLFVSAMPQDNLLYHFDSWQISSIYTNIGDISNSNYSVIKPNDLNDSLTELVKSYTIKPYLVTNKAQSITLKLFIPESVLNNEVTRGVLQQKVWGDIVTSLKNILPNMNSINNGYSITFETDATFDFDKYTAGQEIQDYINTINADYEAMYNTTVGTVNTLNYLLNYMWFTGEWRTLLSDANKFELDASTNIIKFTQGADIVLYTYLEEAILIDVSDVTLDYFVENTQLEGVHRITFNGFNYTYLNDDSVTITSTCNNGVTGKIANVNMYSLANTDNSIIIKMHYDCNTIISVNATPYGATENHVAYLLKEWKTNNAVGSNEADLSTNLNKNNNMYISNTNVISPEVKLVAYMIAKTYDVTFINDGSIITTLTLAYDNELSSTYAQYGFDLNYIHGVKTNSSIGYINSDLYNNDRHTNYLIPIFTLDSVYKDIDKPVLFFMHPDDAKNGAEQYGQFNYLFTNWSLNGITFSASNILKVDGYSNFTLTANYTNTIEISYRVFDNNSEAGYNSFTALLPNGVVKDCYNNEYSDSLWIDYVSSRLASSKGTIVKSPYYFYVSEETSKDNISLSDIMSARSYASVSTVRNLESAGLGYVVYPAVMFTLNIQGIDTNIYTFGGSYVVGNEGEIGNEGEETVKLKIYNLLGLAENEITATGLIRSKTYKATINNDLSFAYWDYNVNNILSSNSKFTENISISEHYNPKFKFNQTEIVSAGEKKGTLTFTKHLENGGSNPYALFNLTPTATYLAGDTTGTTYTYDSTIGKFDDSGKSAKYYLRYDSISKDDSRGIYQSVVGFYSNINGVETLLYKFVFDRSENIETIVEQVTFNIMAYNTIYNGVLKEIKDCYYVNDNSGVLSISASVFGAPVGFDYATNEYFAIENVNSTYKYSSSKYLSFTITNTDAINNPNSKVGSGSICHIEELPLGYKLSFTEYGTNELSSVSAEVNFDGASWYDIKEYLYNFRLQYSADDGQTWVDIIDGVTIVDGYNGKEVLKLRLVASWLNSYVLFDMLDNNDVYTLVNTVHGVEFTLENTKNTTGSYIYVNNEVYSSYKLEILAGDLIYYDFETETIKLTTQNYGEIIVKVDGLGDDLISQGWIQESNGSLVVLKESSVGIGFKAEAKNEKEEPYTYHPVIEKKITSSIQVDTTSRVEGVINGYGKVTLTIDYLKNQKTVILDQIYTQTSDGKTYYTNKDGTIAIVGGESTVVAFTISSVEALGHKFDKMFYGKNTKDDSRKESSSPFGLVDEFQINLSFKSFETSTQYKNYISILFDASNTESSYTIIDGVDDKGKASSDTGKIRYNSLKIYGGYTIEYKEVTDTINIIIKDYFGNVKKQINVYLNTTNTDQNNSDTVNLYASSGFKINNINKYYIKDVRYINNSAGEYYKISNSDTRTTSGGLYTHTDYINKAIVDKFNETLYEFNIKYEIKIKSECEDGELLGEKYTTSTDTAYLKNVNAKESIIKEKDKYKTLDLNMLLPVLISDTSGSAKLSMHYNVNDGGINLNLENGNFCDNHSSDTVVFNPKYQLASVEIDGTTCNYWNYVSAILENSSSPVTVDLTGTTTMVITLIQRQNYDLAFKLTLPYESDLNNLSITGEIRDARTNAQVDVKKDHLINKIYYKSGTNTDNLITTAECVIKVPVGTYVTLQSTADTRVINVFDADGTSRGYIKISFNKNVNTISGEDDKLSTTTESLLGTTYKALKDDTNFIYLDSSPTNKVFKLTNMNWSSTTSGISGQLSTSLNNLKSYKLWGFDSSNENVKALDNSRYTIPGDSTLVIALDRKDVTITLDNTSTTNNKTFLEGAYYCTCGKNIKLSDGGHQCTFKWTENYGFAPYFNSTGEYKHNKDASFTVPGGLAILKPSKMELGYDSTNGVWSYANTLDDFTSFLFNVADNDPSNRSTSSYFEITSAYKTDTTNAGLSIRNNDAGMSSFNYSYNAGLVGTSAVALISAPIITEKQTISVAINDNSSNTYTMLNNNNLNWIRGVLSLPAKTDLDMDSYKKTLYYSVDAKGGYVGFDSINGGYSIELYPDSAAQSLYNLDTVRNKTIISGYDIKLFTEFYSNIENLKDKMDEPDYEINNISGTLDMNNSGYSQYNTVLIIPKWTVKQSVKITLTGFSAYGFDGDATYYGYVGERMEDDIKISLSGNLNVVTLSTGKNNCNHNTDLLALGKNNDKIFTTNIKTIYYNGYFFNGLSVCDSNNKLIGSYKIIGSVENQYDNDKEWCCSRCRYYSDYTENGYSISCQKDNSYTLCIDSLSSDLTITAIFTQYGRTLDYKFTGEVDGKATLTSESQSVTYNLLAGMGISTKYYLSEESNLSNFWDIKNKPLEYFEVCDVTPIYNKSDDLSSISVSFGIRHYKHCLTSNIYKTCADADITTSQHGKFKIAACIYCDYMDTGNLILVSTYGTQLGYTNKGDYHMTKEYCKNCSKQISSGLYTHSYDKLGSVVDSTCTSKGQKYLYCVCGAVKTEAISLKSHAYFNDLNWTGICTTSTLVKKCSNCGKIYSTSYPYKSHSLVQGDKKKDATCVKPAEYMYSCKNTNTITKVKCSYTEQKAYGQSSSYHNLEAFYISNHVNAITGVLNTITNSTTKKAVERHYCKAYVYTYYMKCNTCGKYVTQVDNRRGTYTMGSINDRYTWYFDATHDYATGNSGDGSFRHHVLIKSASGASTEVFKEHQGKVKWHVSSFWDFLDGCWSLVCDLCNKELEDISLLSGIGGLVSNIVYLVSDIIDVSNSLSETDFRKQMNVYLSNNYDEKTQDIRNTQDYIKANYRST